MAVALADHTDVEARLGRSLTEAELGSIGARLASASALVRDATGQYIARVVDDVAVLPVIGDAVELPQRPADEPSVITVDGEALTGWDFDGGVVTGLCGYPRVWVTYSHGYTTIPDTIVDVVCAAVIRRLLVPVVGVRTRTVGQISTTYFEGQVSGSVALTSEERRRLRSWRRLARTAALK